MAYIPTTFVDRSVEFPNRRTLTAVPGQADTVDIGRAEGTVFAEGTKPDAANLNAEFGKIKTETDAINTSLNGLVATLSSKYALLTGTSASSGGLTIAYPTGFTKDNCVVISSMCQHTSNSDYYAMYTAGFLARLQASGIYAETLVAQYASKPFKIMLMRTDI